MIEIQRLEPDEYPVLGEIADGIVPKPETSLALIAHDDHRMVGRVFLMAPVHLEGPWVEEKYRGTTLAHRLVLRAEEEAKRAGVTKLFAYAASDILADYLRRLRYRKEALSVWTKEI